MNHFLYIESREEEDSSLDSKRVLLNEENYKHIIASLDHYPPTAQEVKKAICILVGRLIYRSVWNMETDIDSLKFDYHMKLHYSQTSIFKSCHYITCCILIWN